MHPTDEQLKLALAAELPDWIQHSLEFGKRDSFHWLDTRQFITDREWPWIMAEVEKKLSDSGPALFKSDTYRSQQRLFVCLLAALIAGQELGEWQMPAFGIDVDFAFRLADAPWQARAIAYFYTIGKKIA